MSSHTAFLSLITCFFFSCLQVVVWPQSCHSCWSPVMWLRWGIARSCWTVGCRVKNRSWLRGVKMGFLYPPAHGFGCWQMARCSSRVSRNAERGVMQIWASTTVLPKIAMACWSAARPKSIWHVSVWQSNTAHDCYNPYTFYAIQWHMVWKGTNITQRQEIMSLVIFFPDEQNKRKCIVITTTIISSYSFIEKIWKYRNHNYESLIS